MDMEVWFHANGRNYEALKGRQPDFKEIFFREPKSKPKLRIGPDNDLMAWGSNHILKIKRINGVAVDFHFIDTLKGPNYYHCMLSEQEIENMTEISLIKKLRHMLLGTPKPKITKYVSGIAVSDDGDLFLNDDKNIYKMSKDIDMAKDVTSVVETVRRDVGDIFKDVEKNMQEVGLIADDSKITIKPSTPQEDQQVPERHLRLVFLGDEVTDPRDAPIWRARYGTHTLKYNGSTKILSGPMAVLDSYIVNTVPVRFEINPFGGGAYCHIPEESEQTLLTYADPDLPQFIHPTFVSIIFEHKGHGMWVAKYQGESITYDSNTNTISTRIARLKDVELINQVYVVFHTDIKCPSDMLIHRFPSDFDPTVLLRNPFKDGSPADPEQPSTPHESQEDQQVPAQHLKLVFIKDEIPNPKNDPIWRAWYGQHLLKYNGTTKILEGPPAFNNMYIINAVFLQFKPYPDVLDGVFCEITEKGEQVLLSYSPPGPENLEDAEKAKDQQAQQALDKVVSHIDSMLPLDTKIVAPQPGKTTSVEVSAKNVESKEKVYGESALKSPDKHIPLKESPIFNWTSLSSGVLVGEMSLYGTTLDIKLMPRDGDPALELLRIKTKRPFDDDSAPSLAMLDLDGYCLAVEGTVLQPLAKYHQTPAGLSSHYLTTVVRVSKADAIKIRLGGRTRAELDQLQELRILGKWDEWQELFTATTRPKPPSLRSD